MKCDHLVVGQKMDLPLSALASLLVRVLMIINDVQSFKYYWIKIHSYQSAASLLV